MSIESDTLNEMVQQSIREHIKMVELLSSLEQQIESHSSESVNRFNITFSALQQMTKKTDKKLVELLDKSDVSDSITRLLLKRRSLQLDILRLLQQTVPRAASVKSLMASEIRTVKKGRMALSGYRNQSYRQGGIVNRAS